MGRDLGEWGRRVWRGKGGRATQEREQEARGCERPRPHALGGRRAGGGTAATIGGIAADSFALSGCSHIIKRFDTGGISASSLFRAAFPTATEAQEEREMQWIIKNPRQKYGDTRKAGVEDDETKKLSGTWCVFVFLLPLQCWRARGTR